MKRHRLAPALTVGAAVPAAAATSTVGPGGQYASLQAAFNAVDLGHGDVVKVAGGVTYDVGNPGIVMGAGDSGAPGDPEVVRGGRVGGDGTTGGRGETFGRYRFVNNTIVRIHPGDDTPTAFRLFEGIESLEFHDNGVWRDGPSSLNLVRAMEARWTQGPRVRGRSHWIEAGFTLNPANLPAVLQGTITGGNPGFTSAAALDFTPAARSPLLDAGTASTVTPPDYDLANPLFPPLHHPPWRAPSAPIDIGAYERDSVGFVFSDSYEPALR